MKRTKRYLALLLALLLLVPTSLQAAESQTAESYLEDAVESVTATDVLSTTRTAALNQLASAYASYSESEYTAEAWTLLTEEYGYGQDNIEGAQSYDAIMTALANAKTAMAAVEKSGTVQVAVTIEKLSIDGTYIIEPTLLTVEKKEQASIVITDLLKAYYTDEGTITNGTNGNPYRMTGTESGSFYLAGVYDPTYDPTVLTYNTDGEAFSQEYEGFLPEFDGGRWSGWMYCVNGSFPGVGASNWYMNNGDVMRWQYTCTGLGADIGADSSDWGEEYGSGETTAVADKDDLIWRVAEINEAAGDDRESYLSSQSLTEAYAAAMTALTNLTASQTEVDEALKALGDTNEDRDSLVLESARTTALTTLRNYAQAEDYSEENQELLAQYISEGSAAIYAAASESEVETALAEAEALIDALKTLAQEAAAATTTATEAPTTTAAEETTTTKADETTTTAATAAKGDTVTSGSVKYTVTASGQVTATKVTSKTVTSVKIPSTVSVGGTSCKVTAIAEGAFSGCTKLTGVTIGANVKTIGAKAFYGCTALKKVSGCAAVTSVGKQAFSGCTKLTTVEGLTRTTSIGSKAFYQCKKLTTVGSKSGTVTLAKVKSLGSSAFSGCTALKKVSLTCTSLKTLGTSVFSGCTALTTVSGCSAVTKIGEKTFYGCSKLTTVRGLTKVTSIGSKAFYKCKKLTTVGSKSGVVTLAKVKTVGSSAFYGCTALKKVNLTSTALTTIGASAFQSCTALTSFVSKSAKLASIGKKAFYGDKKLASVTLATSKLTASKVGEKAFSGIKSSCVFKVPSNKVASYKKIFRARGAGSGITVKKN